MVSPKAEQISPQNFFVHLVTGRWFMVFASIIILSMSGATYMFGLYSNDIKSTLGYDQSTLNLIGFFKDLGANVGIISGLFNEIAPPWLVLSLGAAMNFIGYFLIWLVITGKMAKPPVWQMCLYFFIGANSQTFVNTVVVVSCVMNFPESRGIVIGLLKGFVGLSGAIITQIYHAFYEQNTKSLILLVGWLPAVVSIAFLGTIRVSKIVRQANELEIFYQFLYVSLCLAGFLMVLIIVQIRVSFSRIAYVSGTIVTLLLLVAPLGIVIVQELKLWTRKKQFLTDKLQPKVVIENPECSVQQGEQEQKGETSSAQEKKVYWFQNVFNKPERGEDFTILQALFSIDMLALFATTTFGVGGTLTAIDNLGQIGKSLGYPTKSISTFVSLVSIWGYLGRVASGFASEILLSKCKVPRPLMLTIVLLVSCLGHLLIAFGVPNSLYIASLIAGFCFGAQWPLIFAIISELFGLKYYSTLINFGAGASPVGNYIFNVMVAGHLYDKVALKQMAEKGITRKAGESLVCSGVECYRMSFLIITGTTLLGCLFSIVLLIRTRDFYRGDIYKKFKDNAQVVEDPETLTM